jgi:hypothetical protein
MQGIGSAAIGTIKSTATPGSVQDINVADWGGIATTLGQKTMAFSVPVVIASDQSSLPVTIATGTNVIGFVTPTPATGGNTLFMQRTIGLTNTVYQQKNSPGKIYKIHVYNPNTTNCWVNFYDAMPGAITVGVSIPDWSWFIPAGGAFDDTMTMPISAAIAINFSATTTPNGGTAPSSGLFAEFGSM